MERPVADNPRTARDATPVADIERALVALRRSQTRRALARAAGRRGRRWGRHATVADGVVELLDALEAATPVGAGLAVAEAAAALGVDQPRASRLAAQAVAAGLARRDADQADGRRSILSLTADGRALLDGIRSFRQGVVSEATAAWTPDDRAALADLLTRFVRDFAGVIDIGRRPTPEEAIGGLEVELATRSPLRLDTDALLADRDAGRQS